MAETTPSQLPSDRLELLYRLSQTFNSVLDLDEVLNLVMDEVITVTNAERGFVMLHEADGGLAFRAARGMDRSTIDDPQFQVSRSVVERVAREGQAILTSDAQSDDRFKQRESVMMLGLRAILCVPLKIKDKISGVVYVDNRIHIGVFTQDDLELLTSIASSAAIAIENARLYALAVEQGRLERELQMAYEIQAGFLPQETPQIPGWEFAARWQPAREVAGDYYDFIPSAAGQLGLVIADVSDKGMPAALFMTLTRSIIRASVDRAPSPADGIAHANRLICADSTGGMFVTLFYMLLEDKLTELMPTGTALGVFTDLSYEQRTVQLAPGDLILLYTDGVTDATNVQLEDFGEERLQHVVFEKRREPVADMITELEQALSEFVGASLPFDDVTIVAVRRP